MAWKDFWHDRRTMLVFVLTVAAIVAPLLLLLGLKNGVVTNCATRWSAIPAISR